MSEPARRRARRLAAAAAAGALVLAAAGCSRPAERNGAAPAAAAPSANTAPAATAGSAGAAPALAAPPSAPGAPPSAAARAALAPIPAIDLSGAEPGARKQLGEKRAALDTLLARPDAGASELTGLYGDLGLLYVTYEFLGAAEVCFADAGALEPGSYRWTYLLGYLKALQGKLDEAVPLLEKTLALEPSYLPAVLRLGRARLEQGEYPQARAQFEKALELDSGAAAAYEGLGKVAAAGGDAKTAVARFQRALALDPQASGLHYALGQAYRNLGDLDRARGELEQSGDVQARIDDPLINPLASVAESAQFYLVQGAEALDHQDYANAAAAFRSAQEKDAGSYLAYRGLALALQRLGDLAGAERTLDSALDKATAGAGATAKRRRAEALRLLGDLAAAQGQDDRAFERWRGSLALLPEQPAVLLKVGNAEARRGRFAEAVASYDRLIALAPGAAPAVLEKRATALVNLGRKKEAIADFRRALEAAPNDALLRLRFSDALDFLGDHAGAAEQRAAAERLAPTGAGRADLALDEAHRQEAAGDFAGAIAQYRQALAAAPAAVDARYGLASVLGHVGRYGEAADEFARVIAAAPRHLAARRGQALALILGERYGEARVALQEALKVFPREEALALTQVRLLALSPDLRVRDGALAVEIARRVYADSHESVVRDSLALAYAAAGRYPEAAELERALVAEAEQAGDSSVLAARRARLAAFERGEPWSATSPDEIVAPLAAG